MGIRVSARPSGTSGYCRISPALVVPTVVKVLMLLSLAVMEPLVRFLLRPVLCPVFPLELFVKSPVLTVAVEADLMGALVDRLQILM